MSITYKYKFTDYELQKLNLITNDSIKLSLMSILSYMKLYNQNRNTDYEMHRLDMLKKDADQLKISFENLHDAYVKFLKKHGNKQYIISLQTLKNRLEKLIELKLLIVVSKIKKTNVYAFISNVSENISDIENITSLENTCVQDELLCPKYINNKYINTYTLNTTDVVKSEVEKVHALDLVHDVFNDLKVKSKVIKSMVIAKLKNIILDAAGAIKYIVTVLTEKTEQYNLMRVKYAQQVAKTKYSKSKNSYKPNTAKERGFNNFDAREYYDDPIAMKSLEKKLLGWD